MILQEIARQKRIRLDAAKQAVSLEQIRERAMGADRKPSSFRGALKRPGLSVIAEIKKASPSKGLICRDFDPVRIASEYEIAGAAAISVLTEEDFFLGSPEYLKSVKAAVHIPVLRKDFLLEPWQIYESRLIGADAVLLIAAILSADELNELRLLANELGMDALVEAHDEEELQKALSSGTDIIGVNNRNLNTFSVDPRTTAILKRMIPPHITVVSESGIETGKDTEYLRSLGINAVLVGESLMRAPSRMEKMRELKGGAG